MTETVGGEEESSRSSSRQLRDRFLACGGWGTVAAEGGGCGVGGSCFPYWGRLLVRYDHNENVGPPISGSAEVLGKSLHLGGRSLCPQASAAAGGEVP